MPHPILLYDGVCGFCNRFVRFILRRDREQIFRFAPLQSDVARRILMRHSAKPDDLDTVYVVLEYERHDERLLSHSSAALFVLKRLGGGWRAAASILRIVPKFLGDAAYNALARRRYRIFGRSEACTPPCDRDHSRFLDVSTEQTGPRAGRREAEHEPRGG
jgi:predicted DCC family thiol-disulfide oxidoreductase YuxK